MTQQIGWLGLKSNDNFCKTVHRKAYSSRKNDLLGSLYKQYSPRETIKKLAVKRHG